MVPKNSHNTTKVMSHEEILEWLLEGDVSIQYQVRRDLLKEPEQTLIPLRERIMTEGWGATFLERQQPSGHWGRGFYVPKWISTHYTLLDLRTLELPANCEQAKLAIKRIRNENLAKDGGLDPTCGTRPSDVCINGMFLNYASHFETDEEQLKTVVDFILSQKMPDGGFNCNLNQSGAKHSSLHTTISVLEGIQTYKNKGYQYRLDDLEAVRETSHAFLFEHKLFQSDKTGEIIHPQMLKMYFPTRWKYDAFRALDYLQTTDLLLKTKDSLALSQKTKEALQPAIAALEVLQKKDGRWHVPSKHPGEVHFDMEKAGQPSRWNTLRALRILNWYQS
jgi:hypothetical protein